MPSCTASPNAWTINVTNGISQLSISGVWPAAGPHATFTTAEDAMLHLSLAS